jgi:hypothetical protein
MSATPNKIWTRCPACRCKYLVAVEAVGHHARCRKCQTRFRVEEYNPHPTEEDILRWLNEGAEEEEVSPRPRIISGSARMPMPRRIEPSTVATQVVVQNVRARSA